MKLYTEKEIRTLIENKAICLVGEELILDNEYITTNQFVQSLKQIIDFTKENRNKMELIQCEDVGEYRKGNGQKKRSKIRKK